MMTLVAPAEPYCNFKNVPSEFGKQVFTAKAAYADGADIKFPSLTICEEQPCPTEIASTAYPVIGELPEFPVR